MKGKFTTFMVHPDVVQLRYSGLNISYLPIPLTRNIKVSEVC
jgi:hypothetical protein